MATMEIGNAVKLMIKQLKVQVYALLHIFRRHGQIGVFALGPLALTPLF